MKFNFDILSPIEFEELSKDIIEKKLSMEFKVFKIGKDGGIDLRNKDNGIICQCKHIKKYSDLKSNLKKEVDKIKKIKGLKKYYLIVSTELSPQNEDEIFDLLSDYINSSEQIISQKEIISYLDDKDNLEILKRNSKIWLTSYRVLELFEQKFMDFQVSSLYNLIQRDINYFVETKIFRECYEKIKNERILIISGSPGVGKTINSNMIVAKLLSEDQEIKLKTITGSNYVELIKSLNMDSKEIIILDDFLGQSYLEKSDAQINEIISIINYVQKNQNKYLLLNSRLVVLSETKLANEKFSRIFSALDDKNYIINMDQITSVEKAKIIYNLHYFNNVPFEYFDELRKIDFWQYRYEFIINNRNYNTRIIEYCILNYKKDSISVDQYYDYIINNLNNPTQIWKKQFNNFSNEELAYLHTMYSISSSNVSNDVFKECYEKVSKSRKFNTEKNTYNNITQKMSNSIIKQQCSNGKYIFDVLNPSINDYIMNDLKDNNLETEKMLEECIYIEQLSNLVELNNCLIDKININLLNLKSVNGNLETKILQFVKKYNYCSDCLKEFLTKNFNDEKILNSTILEILSQEILVKFYGLREFILNVNYLKKIFSNSTNYYIKKFISFMDDYIETIEESDRIDYLNNFYKELASIIESKISDEVSNDVLYDIDDIIKKNLDKVDCVCNDGEYSFNNQDEVINIIVENLNPILDEKIANEIEEYNLYNIDFQELEVNNEDCYTEDYIDEKIQEFKIDALEDNSDERNKDDDEKVTVYDVIFQEYK